MKTSELTLHLKIWLWSLMGDMMIATVKTANNNNFIEL